MSQIINKLIENDGICQILLYGDIGQNQPVNALDIDTELQQAKALKCPIELHINSRGGEVYEGFTIINTVKQCDNLTIFVDGVAASMGAMIALCGKPVYMYENSRLMIHSAKGGVHGGVDDLKRAITELEGIENELCNVIAKKLKCSELEVKQKYFDGNDHWFSASEALNVGLINGVIVGKDNEQKDANELYKAVNLQKGVIDYPVFKECLNKVLSLRSDSTERDILRAIDRVKANAITDNAKSTLQKVIDKGIINPEDKDLYLTLYKSDAKSFTAKIEELRNIDRAKVNDCVDAAINRGQIFHNEKDVYLQIGEEMGAKLLNKLIATKPRQRMIAREISPEFQDRNNWTLDDWKHNDPKALTDNPKLYELLKAKQDGTPTEIKDLAWYRKHNPKFLEEHPDFYQSLINSNVN